MSDNSMNLFVPVFCIDGIPQMKLIGYTDIINEQHQPELIAIIDE